MRTGRVVAALALLSVLGVLGWVAFERYRGARTPVVVPPKAAVAPAASDTVADPLAPDRPARLDASARPATGDDWVTARPQFQYSRTPAERGGENPCALPEGDSSAFDAWQNLAKGRFTAPRDGALDAEGQFDLVIHLHGDELARRELAASGQKFVLYSLTLSPGENYAALFSGTGLYGQIVAGVATALRDSRGGAARARHVVLSAWSAGYMGILAMLAQPEAKDVDAIVLIDGMHGPRDALDRQLAPFVDFARRAAAGERFFVVTHSSIDPPDFASTTESAHHVIAALGGRPRAVRRNDRYGLELVEFFSQGDLHVRGYAGNDKADHCAQVTLLRDAYLALGRRWERGPNR